MLAGELHNSTWTNIEYMSTIWADTKARHINTLLGGVSWALMEPIEGQFNFRELDQVINDARCHGIHLVLLWFGMYKNALSGYAPSWVRQDVKRFPRIHIKGADGGLQTIDAVQPTCEAGRKADATAFAALMRHLKEIDEEHQTVIMVQIENEIGIMGDTRDRSRTSNELFKGPVRQELLQHLRSSWTDLHPTFRVKFPNFPRQATGSLTWSEAFGEGEWAEDIFMADAFSGFVQNIALAGRREYQLPVYINVALCSEDPSWDDFSQIPEGIPTGNRPGAFPSGGPVGHNMDVYIFNAPEIAFYAPDIYLQDYEKITECFAWRGLPLFIPEQRRDDYGVRRIWTALANQLSIGCSPFGIDSQPLENCTIPLHFGLLSKLSKHILDAQANRPDDLFGFFYDNVKETTTKRTWIKDIGQYRVTVDRPPILGKQASGAGMVIRQPDGTYLVAGYGFQLTFTSLDPETTYTGILAVTEKDFDTEGNLYTIRTLNGDETNHHKNIIMHRLDPDHGGFPIPFITPATTMITSVTLFTLHEKSEDF